MELILHYKSKVHIRNNPLRVIKRRSISMYKHDVHYDFVLVNMTNNGGIITFT